jgi:arylsulfatase A-like enzyme/Tfp pilus assembly protein PilF
VRQRGPLSAAGFALLLATTVAGAGALPAPAKRPSVLLVTLDTTRADHLGAYGAAFARTPTFDTLARSGVRFERALAPTPLTLPSHATILTALVPRRHGVRDNTGFRLAAEVPTLAERLREAGYATAAFVSSAVLDRTGGLDRGFALYDDGVRVGDRSAFGHVERAAAQTTDAVLARLPDLAPPFFLWVHYFDPHLPYVPPEPWRGRFQDRPYDGEIAYMDSEMGRLLEAVRRKDARLVIAVAGDHGESLGEHGEGSHGVFLYEATQRVPMVLAGPGVPEGRVVASPAGLVDLAPTVLDLLGLPALGEIDGRSLVPSFRRGTLPATDYEMETFYPRFAFGWAPLRGLVRGPWKWIDAPRPELYDVAADPGERADLFRARPDDARRLARALAERVGADDPAPPPSDAESEERRARLAALGYVAGGGATGSPVDPKDGIAWLADLEAGRRALQTGNPRDGIAPLERLVSRNPENLQAWIALGMCRLASGDPRRAEADLREAVVLAPDRALAWVRLGDALAARARTDEAARREARSAYEKALALHPREADAYLGLLLVLALAQDGAAIDALAARARREGWSDPVFDTEIGLLALARGRAAEAEASLRRAVAADPGAARALEGLGKLAYGRGEAREAERWYARALEAAPSAALAKTLGAIRLHDLEDPAGARDAFTRALVLMGPADPDRAQIETILRELPSP